MRKIKLLTTFFLLVCGALLLMSHTIWMESTYKGVEGDEVVFNLYFGEFEKDLREKDEKINSLNDFKAVFIHENNAEVAVPLRKTSNSMQGKFIASGAGFYQILAVNDEREVQDLSKHGLTILRPIEYQRSSFTAFSDKPTEKISVEPYFYLDIIPDYTLNHKGEFCSIYEANKSINATIYFKKQLLPTTPIKVYSPDKKITTITSDNNGKFAFMPFAKGTYLISAIVNDSTAGNFKGKDYKLIRYHVSTTVNVE